MTVSYKELIQIVYFIRATVYFIRASSHYLAAGIRHSSVIFVFHTPRALYKDTSRKKTVTR